ncbi:helix-turn-helix domain-containing protein [Gracilibacillus alcaliphilus]|uniref:helix-turn-helix domain-containing protein n=1 Tax=Gracilibacillus alcaliphilus TaxID=1401441 RepID=UPI00195CC9C7|nr:helix-turn-helix domain-containing protein [Gracilibacillus alcaliphilus]MBM7676566.1 transposase [Gracilibacillus alcaliphilus]
MTELKRKTFTVKFKKQMVQLYLNGVPFNDIITENKLNASTFDRWINRYGSSVYYEQEKNILPKIQQHDDLYERIQLLEEEKNILKQALLIIGQKQR